MKRFAIVALALCALVTAGAVYALSVQETVEVVSLSAAQIAGLPTTVLDQEAAAFTFCPPKDFNCPDVYDPVTCSNGVTYSNGCYAFLACATGCSGGGADS